MSKSISDSAQDAKLNKVGTATAQHACSGDPTDRTEVLAQSLATVAPTFGAIGSPGGGTQRQLPVDQQAGVTVDSTGTAAVFALIDGTELLAKTDLAAPTPVTAATSVTFGAWNVNGLDPV